MPPAAQPANNVSSIKNRTRADQKILDGGWSWWEEGKEEKGAALPTPTALMLDTKQRALPNDNQTTCEVQQQHQQHSSSNSNTGNSNSNNNAQVTVGAALIWPR
ncbi:uncharacterized protein [Drosophila takahashii]|uniref:uncharacterized protein n=1 Tax=Drosophila takahashii TaxID=29030 RepID=UPI00389937C4